MSCCNSGAITPPVPSRNDDCVSICRRIGAASTFSSRQCLNRQGLYCTRASAPSTSCNTTPTPRPAIAQLHQ
ncbi:hypothetical protein Y032_0017g3464 [Ancylostoma ceylanicum]|uniref:Uncharacterized protein n=1 Tax=Ancylostoma ceylanicum TaxID=53326 RepID=A0A016V5C0_9BILA|nr:hypothetical protein Y032_0017g3464 [Ancylostoma ceylanicum]